MNYVPHKYQDHSTQHVITNPFSALLLEMGLGKTVSTLTAIEKLIYDYFEVDKVLVIAPLRVAESTWTDEIAKWDHLKHLTVSKVLGAESTRKAALLRKADIYLINRENVPWLVSHLAGHWIFDMVVIDELSSFKSSKSARFKALRSVRPKMKRVVGLTGTPSPNGLIDLWSQMFLIDMGQRLGKSITNYRQTFFHPGASNGQVVFNYKINKGSENEIFSRIEDICISMKAVDYLDLPERMDHTIKVLLSEEQTKEYQEFEKNQVLALCSGPEISVANAAALTNKLLQYANGALYDENKNWHEVHDAKLDALGEIIEEANGKPVLVFYSYKHDLARIQKKFGKSVRVLDTPQDIEDWNAGKIEIFIAHPASAGHGLNLQHGGNIIVWFGLPWSLELYQQAVARLHRQGQSLSVMNYRLITQGTMDQDVLRALDHKAIGQDALMEAVKARIDKYKDSL